MKLSKNLSLSEVTKSQQAIKLGISNEPTPEHLENLKLLAEKVFQPIREHFGVPIFISSGYRSEALNKAVKGSKTSQHCKGEAIDIDMDGTSVSNADVFEFIQDNLEFSQLIAEFPKNGNPSWVHVGYDKNNLKKEILVAKKINGKTIYSKYNNEKDLI